ncbi:hypothetical protein [Acaryochloris thomasi]|uniref:hypothetical protein n=1 Tax=Acaryochloris thomasi TaxID=2929456 RepID=UPI001F2D44CA|nr:hypothetical protein [Acaryochloris thomasi]
MDHVPPSPLLRQTAEVIRVLLEPVQDVGNELGPQLVVIIEIADEIALSRINP